MTYTRNELINKLDDFLENKEVKKRSAKDYRVDCMCFINFYLKHKHIQNGQMYNMFIKALNKSKLSETTKRRRILIVGEFLIFIDMYSSTHIIIKNTKNNQIKYYDAQNREIYLLGNRIDVYSKKGEIENEKD